VCFTGLAVAFTALTLDWIGGGGLHQLGPGSGRDSSGVHRGHRISSVLGDFQGGRLADRGRRDGLPGRPPRCPGKWPVYGCQIRTCDASIRPSPVVRNAAEIPTIEFSRTTGLRLAKLDPACLDSARTCRSPVLQSGRLYGRFSSKLAMQPMLRPFLSLKLPRIKVNNMG
jgi:hypothetical protein